VPSSTHGPLSRWGAGSIAIVVISAFVIGGFPPRAIRAVEELPGHLVISEIVTGGASASDELIEIYNPGPETLPLEGLELVYVTASGATVSRRASWALGAPALEPGRHVLVAHELGVFAAIADELYASGMAATGGSVALRIQGATTAIDAVGWGTAASTWMEGTPAAAPAPGSSLERLPGGAWGSTQDTDDNAVDFVVRTVPDPQNLGSAPTPGPDGPPTPSPATPAPTPTPPTPPTPSPTSVPAPTIVPISTVRQLAEGAVVTIEATSLTGSTFSEGGGYLADATGGVAVLMSDGAFERGQLLRVTGTVDDRFAQRTIRAASTGLQPLGSGTEPSPLVVSTGDVGEAIEGRLVRLAGLISGSPTSLSGGLAYDLDDGSGKARVTVWGGTAIDTTAWVSGTSVELVGVVGQRDSSGTGSSGYRVQPRDSGDVIAVSPPGSASPAPSSQATPQPSSSASPAPSDGLVSIADARAAPKNTRVRVRGIVTLPPGVVDPDTAAIQDGSGAIILRLGDEVGPLAMGEWIEVEGTRSTKTGMETLRVTKSPNRLGTRPDPEPLAVRTGDVAESHEAKLITVKGALVAGARRSATGSVSFDVDDGSGPLRIVMPASLGADPGPLTGGSWVEVRAVLGQDTTGAQPLRGYRAWPRRIDEVRVLAAAGDRDADVELGPGSGGDGGEGAGPAAASLSELERADLSGLRIGATLVAGTWPEIGVGGLLWDGRRLVAIAVASTDRLAAAVGPRRAPLVLELGGLRTAGAEPRYGLSIVSLGTDPADVVVASGAPAVAATSLPGTGESPRWVSVVGLVTGDTSLSVEADGQVLSIERRCDGPEDWAPGIVRVSGIGLVSPARLVVGCGGMVPAPSLARSAVARAVAVPGVAVGEIVPAAVGDERRAGAALLLGLGALVLAGAAGARRWLREPDPSPGDDTEGSEPEPGATEEGPPPLTLVRTMREHGSG
jgi:hypothetical protein